MYDPTDPIEGELDIELSDSPVCSYAHHNTAEPCWGTVVFRGIAPTCTGHSTMVSRGHYTSQEQVEKAKTTRGTIRLSSNCGAMVMRVPEELSGMWKGAPKDKVVPEITEALFLDMVRPEVPRNPTDLQLGRLETDVVGMDSVILDNPMNPNVKISVSDDTEIPEAWKDYL